jgi:hypothetical protein
MEIALRRQLLNPQMDLFRRGFCFEGDGTRARLAPLAKRSPSAPCLWTDEPR